MSELFIIEIYSSAVYFLLIFILLFKLGQFFYLRLGFVEILVQKETSFVPSSKSFNDSSREASPHSRAETISSSLLTESS